MDELLELKPCQKREWKEAEYAVYCYSPNKETLEKSPSSAKIVGAGFSLSLVGTSILPDREHFLREQVGTKLSQSTLYPGSGQVTTLDPDRFPPPSQSYYCLIQSFSGAALETRLQTWFSENIGYLSRVVHSCHSQLPALLHTAVNSTVEVVGESEQTVRDVRLFVEACSLANLMQFEGGSTDSSQQPPVTITVSEEEGCTVSSNESSKFCENWAQVLLAQGTSSPDPFFLRHAVENYKLKIIQDINALKRLLRQAESDYHALFRCYAFLCVCGNGKLLLQCASQEAQSLPSPEALGVLEALHVFSDRCGFSLRTS